MKIQELMQDLSNNFDRAKCWVKHDWSKWQSHKINIVGVKKPYQVDAQKRYCLKCSYIQIERY